MDFITVTAKTVQDAILEASLQLETFRDNIEYEVIEEGTSGFFGFGGKKAVIRARKKVAVEDILKEDIAEAPKKTEKREYKREKKEFKRDYKETKREYKEFRGEKKEERKETREVREPEVFQEERKPVKKEETAAEVSPVMEETDREERHERRVAVLTPQEQEEVKNRAEKFLKDVFASIDMEVGVETTYADEVLNVELSGDEMGVLIGKRGQTLDSLQYLTSLVVNKGRSGYTRVKVDTENYRSRRKETLENLARNVAFKVKRTRRPVFLEPMNPYERRIIHSALQNDPYVTTHSEGEEPYRKVVVTLKRNNNRDKS
ncbi:R3H domain protein [Marvinbryantia formatexigens DSM 14469]|uniref:RNA-binding protein KhpB n=1 Tax=Marvinbryantia formatexigens DSM 14469 TaxID=478749 RepID=C6LKJ7_9FIRM|nr:RNA-binding cell elongation regulator Jag/EloR [Marvinbryantia formatexigens]EET58896.1 R3H domain protein [Marvinbryantia formatexigens DSM 14469]UWO26714.1 Jag N-terminal domain-containing protein [Marvinbryantia formatexigens DSM 14469]SDG88413.1 spoIIIJ-associated protein [Marvinbryantia formatexigens]